MKILHFKDLGDTEFRWVMLTGTNRSHVYMIFEQTIMRCGTFL